MNLSHTFQIPVMGIGYTIDTPIKVAHYGIDSVISLVDDNLIEKMRKHYCNKANKIYNEISTSFEDFRAKRITSYLDLVKEIVDDKFTKLKDSFNEANSEFHKYLSMLPNSDEIKNEFLDLKNRLNNTEIKKWIDNNLKIGSIDVNIMSKLDKTNYLNNKELSSKYNDAHSALRGFAKSKLNSAVILSAGMNPNLYSYLEEFDDFFPNEEGELNKRVILKVSDFRSATVQGKYLAKKGIWVSEFRIESGLNCGGHAFATDGILIGPILEEFKNKKNDLAISLNKIYKKALEKKNRTTPKHDMRFKISAQGGVGSNNEHNFLLNYYKTDSVGWGSPFLLAKDVVSIDDTTLNSLIKAKENDLYLSNISPLGVLFNNIKNNTMDNQRDKNIKNNTPGAYCTNRFLALDNHFEGKSLCTASKQYQKLKIKELNNKNLENEEYQKEYNKITEKSCICVGLGISSLKAKNIDTIKNSEFISICPGPNIAYFNQETNLKEMTNYIYGKSSNLKIDNNRPNMFIKEITIYFEYIKNKIAQQNSSEDELNYFKKFFSNLKSGIEYYENLFNKNSSYFKDKIASIKDDLNKQKNILEDLISGLNINLI